MLRHLALVLFLFPALATALPVEVSHPVAPFLRRLEEKGLITPGFWSTLPRDRSEVAAALAQAQGRAAELHAWDRRKLERYLDEFDPERRKRGTRLRYEDSLLSLTGSVKYFTGIYTRDSLPGPEAFAFGSFTPAIEGTYREFAYFAASATVGMERNWRDAFTMTYDPQLGMPYNTARPTTDKPKHDANTFDGFRAVLGFGDSRLALEAGQDWNQWGPGRWQHATLSARPYFWVSDSLAASTDNGRDGSQTGFAGTNPASYGGHRKGYRFPGEGAPMPQLRFRAGGGRWEYVKIVAERKGINTDSTAKLVAHRLQVRFGNWKFGGTEMTAIGNRPIDAILLLPGIPLKFAEHSGGDQDNAAMSGDVEWTIPGRGRVYGELLLDDFSGPPLDFWGNKLAWVVGGSLQDPLGLPSELHLEYAHVDPWVYGHRNYNTALQHYGALIGSALPPNSRALFASADFPLPYGIEGSVEWAFRQRDLKSPGSSIFDDYARSPFEETKHFLEGDVETRNAVTASAEWHWKRHAQLNVGLGGLWVSNWKGKAGSSLVTPTVGGEVRLGY